MMRWPGSGPVRALDRFQRYGRCGAADRVGRSPKRWSQSVARSMPTACPCATRSCPGPIWRHCSRRRAPDRPDTAADRRDLRVPERRGCHRRHAAGALDPPPPARRPGGAPHGAGGGIRGRTPPRRRSRRPSPSTSPSWRWSPAWGL